LPKKPTDALGAALRLISYRERTTAELTERLGRKGFTPAEIDGAIDRLRTLGYIDDARFARMLAESRIRNKHWGPARIRADLAKKGVPADIAGEVVSTIDPESEATTAADALARWLKRNGLSAPLDPKGFARAYRHLAALGFSSAALMRSLGPMRHYDNKED